MEIGKKNIESVAICSVFSPVNDEMEKKALQILVVQFSSYCKDTTHIYLFKFYICKKYIINGCFNRTKIK